MNRNWNTTMSIDERTAFLAQPTKQLHNAATVLQICMKTHICSL